MCCSSSCSSAAGSSFVASTSTPDGRWVAQQARNLLMLLADREQSFRFLLHDRGSKFSRGLDEVFCSEGMKIVRTPIRAPNANGDAERWVATIRRECHRQARRASRPSSPSPSRCRYGREEGDVGAERRGYER